MTPEPAPPERPRGARDSSPPMPAGTAFVLVVDGDAVTRRYVELALGPERRLHVEAVATATAAIELLRTTPCDVVITEARLPDLDGLEFVRRLRARNRQDLSIVILSADERVERKVAAFAAGADDYLNKPCGADELRARVVRRALGSGATRAAQQARVPTLAGQLRALPLPDLVGVLAMGRTTATLELHTPRGEGVLFFEDGRLVHAAYLTLVGARAFYHLFAEDGGAFHLYDGCATLERTVDESVTALIMEAARRLDTARATGAVPVIPVPRGAPAVALPTNLHRLTPERELALGFTRDITDGYGLASLELIVLGAVSDWSRRAGAGPRLQVAIVAPAVIGAAAVASMSTAPGERELAAAIDRDPHCLTATLRGRDRRELDLVVIDLGHGAPTATALGRRPDLAILAAPEGDLLPMWSHYLELLGLLAPAVVVTVGDRRFGHAVAGELAASTAAVASSHRDAALGDPGELRRAIAEALRLWLTGAR